MTANVEQRQIAERIEYLRGELRSECLSWGEVAELESLADHISPGDVEMLEAAGVPEKQRGRDDDDPRT